MEIEKRVCGCCRIPRGNLYPRGDNHMVCHLCMVKIDRDIPMPEDKAIYDRATAAMQVGDSIWITWNQYYKMRYRFEKRGWKFYQKTERKDGMDGVRFWRKSKEKGADDDKN